MKALLAERVLGRKPATPIVPAGLYGCRVMVTGAAGSIGQRAVELLAPHCVVDATDVDELDVTQPMSVRARIRSFRPDVVLHLAAGKHAPVGEESPEEALLVNATGTANVVYCAGGIGAHVVTASTCKACNPETVYGASKLIAERVTLNAAGAVARFHNVVETQGNVFDVWAALEPGEALPVVEECSRFFIGLDDAVSLLLFCMTRQGRYMTLPGLPLPMLEVARRAYPGREVLLRQRRRGDRRREPLHAEHEVTRLVGGGCIAAVTSPHDGVVF